MKYFSATEHASEYLTSKTTTVAPLSTPIENDFTQGVDTNPPKGFLPIKTIYLAFS